MAMDHQCFCHGDDITSLDLNKPEHLMPMMRPFSMRLKNVKTILTNMLNAGMLTKQLFHGDGKVLAKIWRATNKMPFYVNAIHPKHMKKYLAQNYEDDLTTLTVTAKHFNKMPLQITKPAPQFKTTAVVNGEFKDIALSDYKGKYVVLFFYPLDFTFVCPTEIIAFSERADDFRKIGCEVIAASTDSHFTHLAWINTPRKQGGLGPMNIPIISDKSHSIARDYGILNEETGIPFRGLFIIDDKGLLRQVTINDLPVGRSVEETLRLVQAFQYTDKYGEVCPANWTPGSKTIKPETRAAQEYFVQNN